MSKANILVGLELGTSKVSVVVGEVFDDNAVKILGVGQSPSKGIKKGEIIDYDAAQSCIHDTLVKAEDVSNVMIRSVFLNITGSHVKCVNNRGRVVLPDHSDEVSKKDLEEVKAIARNVDIDDDNVFIHSIIQQYRLDNQGKIANPVGLLGRNLEADYHVIFGLRNRIHNAIRCVREIPLEIEDVVFAPVAAAQILLTRQNKRDGAMVIDIGAGTLDFVIYDQGAIVFSGCIPVAGDLITSDISQVLKISIDEAEEIKITHGELYCEIDDDCDVTLNNGEVVKKSYINEIILARCEEMLEILLKKIENFDSNLLNKLGSGIYLSGGTSILKKIDKLIQKIFGLKVSRGNNMFLNGNVTTFENPQFITCIGLLRYGQIVEMTRPESSMIKKFTESIGDFFGTG